MKVDGVPPRRFRLEPINVLYGMLMGAADIVPGVSGGTMALIVGIYERLIASIRGAATAGLKGVRGRITEARRELLAIEWGFLIPLLIGIGTALVIGARIIEPLLESYPIQARALFFGLIAASLSVPWKRIRERHRGQWLIAAAAAVIAFLLVGIPPRSIADPTIPVVFGAAAVAICAMILPGVSGSFLLLVMGMYEPTLEALNSVNLGYIAVFGLGAVVGLGAFSKLLHFLLRHHHDLTMAALVGLMVGSLRALWPYQDEARTLLAPSSPPSYLTVLGLALVGFLVVATLTRIGAVTETRDREAEHSVDTRRGRL